MQTGKNKKWYLNTNTMLYLKKVKLNFEKHTCLKVACHTLLFIINYVQIAFGHWRKNYLKNYSKTMMKLNNVEFYATPDGEVMVKEHHLDARKLKEADRTLVQELLINIRDRHQKAFRCLSELYSSSERNHTHFEYIIIHRFARCNFGEYDQQNYDIDSNGIFQFEEVRCPLRGECIYEGVICKPELNTTLSGREMDVLRLISEGMQANDIAGELNIAVATVNRHRENIKAKINVKTIAQMVNYYVTNFKK